MRIVFKGIEISAENLIVTPKVIIIDGVPYNREGSKQRTMGPVIQKINQIIPIMDN